LPVAAFALMFAFLPVVDLLGLQEKREAVAEEKQEVELKKKELDKKLEELEALAEKKGFPDLKELIESLREKQTEAKTFSKDSSKKELPSGAEPKKEALLELTKMEDRLKSAMSSQKYEAMKKALEKLGKTSLRDFELTRKLREALKAGDVKKALDEMGDLKRQLQNLLKKKPSELTDAQRATLKKLGEELAQLSQDASQLDRLSRALSDMAKGLDSLDLSRALDSLDLSTEQLEDLARQLGQLDMMRQTLEWVRLTKEDLRNLSRLAQLNQLGQKICPICGKPIGLPRPGQKPGST
jgi:hypothetical protein